MIIAKEGVSDHTGGIAIIYRVIFAVGKHVVAQQALPSGDEYIRIEESTQLRIVISGLEIIQLSIYRSPLAIGAKSGLFWPIHQQQNQCLLLLNYTLFEPSSQH